MAGEKREDVKPRTDTHFGILLTLWKLWHERPGSLRVMKVPEFHFPRVSLRFTRVLK